MHASFLFLVKVEILIVHGMKGHGICSLRSEAIENTLEMLMISVLSRPGRALAGEQGEQLLPQYFGMGLLEYLK